MSTHPNTNVSGKLLGSNAGLSDEQLSFLNKFGSINLSHWRLEMLWDGYPDLKNYATAKPQYYYVGEGQWDQNMLWHGGQRDLNLAADKRHYWPKV